MLHFAFRRTLCYLTLASAFVQLQAQNHTTAAGSTNLGLPISEYNNLYLKANPAGRLELQAQAGTSTQLMGYTDQVTPADVEMPDNMRYWLQCVDQAAEDVAQNPRLKLGTTSATTAISPLLGNIQWNQTYPYDIYCPTGTPVGCVATAVAQVMYYYRYPEHGYGQHSWTYGTKKHTVDYDSAYYQWDLMFDKYTRSCTTEQGRAVALLSYHVGVAINMQYNAGGSGTWSELVPEALRTHFGYNSHMSSIYRHHYSFADWSELLQNELRSGRPIVFAANDGQYGHCFVIDGINSKGLYHVNWGWGGYYDGYFDIGILNPEGSGTGGGHSDYGYCFDQTCLINFCPEEGVGEMQNPVTSSYDDFNIQANGIELNGLYANCTGDTLKVVPTIQLCNAETDSTYYVFGTDTLTLYPYPTYSRNKAYVAWGVAKAYPDTLPDGRYSLRNYCKVISTQGELLMPLLCSHYYNPADQFATVQDHTFSPDSFVEHGPYPTVNSFNLQGQELPACFDYDAVFEIQNTGDDYFFGEIHLTLQDKNSRMKHEVYLDDPNIRIAPGEVFEATFPLCIDEAGDWVGKITFADRTMGAEGSADQLGDEAISFRTIMTGDSPAKLNLLYVPKMLTTRPQQDGEISFRLLVSNTGNTFASQVGMLFYNNSNHTGTPLLTISQDAEVAAGCTRDTLIITGQLSELMSGNVYYAWAAQLTSQGTFKRLLRNGEEVLGREVRIYPPAAIEQIHPDSDPDSAPAYDLMGRPVPALSDTQARSRLFITNGKIVNRTL